jgi:hypothetical protein
MHLIHLVLRGWLFARQLRGRTKLMVSPAGIPNRYINPLGEGTVSGGRAVGFGLGLGARHRPHWTSSYRCHSASFAVSSQEIRTAGCC